MLLVACCFGFRFGMEQIGLSCYIVSQLASTRNFKVTFFHLKIFRVIISYPPSHCSESAHMLIEQQRQE